MKISLEWLNEYVDLSDVSVEEIAKKLTVSTAEVEGIEEINHCIENIVVAEVIEAEKIEDLHKVTVDIGSKKCITFCAAPNVKIGLKTAFAPIGTLLNDTIKVEKRKFANTESDGVLCSAKEMSLSEHHKIIFECPQNIKNGTKFTDLIARKDFLIEIDNKSITHRPDLWGHYGFARELAAIFGKELKPLKLFNLSTYDNLEKIKINVQDSQDCPCYSALRFQVKAFSPTPLYIQRRLHVLAQQSFNLMVDLTNYVMLELGQPTHAFDGKKVKSIKVSKLGKKESLILLDNVKYPLLEEDLVIFNENTPIALAGIMGGKSSEISQDTTEVLLESANFSSAKVRLTAVRLNLRTDAAMRFEKKQPPVNTKIAIERLLQLIDESKTPFDVNSALTIKGDLLKDYRYIKIDKDFFSKRAGITIEPNEAKKILESLGFKIKIENSQFECAIPPFRGHKDISIPVDILEEVLRIYGYDNIAPSLPEKELKPVPSNPIIDLCHTLSKVLSQSTNFYEIDSYAWFDSDFLAKIGYEPQDVLKVRNPSAINNVILRDTLLPNILKALEFNLSYQQEINLFEIGKTYKLQRQNNVKETLELSGIMYKYNQKDSFALYSELKDTLEKLFKTLKISYHFKQKTKCIYPWHWENQSVDIFSNEKIIGQIGILPKKILQPLSSQGVCAWFSIDVDALISLINKDVIYKPLCSFPGSTHDFSIIWDIHKGYFELEKMLNTFTHPYIAEKHLISWFKLKETKDKMSYTFRYLLQSLEKTLSFEDIETFRKEFMAFLKKENISLK